MQKLRSSIYILILIAAAFGLVFLSGCEKEPKNNSNQSPTTVLLRETNYLPSQFIFISLDKPWSEPPSSLNIGNQQVDCYQNDTQLIAICPNLPSGEYDLAVAGHLNKTITINPIRQFVPKEVYDSLLLSFNNNKDAIPSNYSTQFNYWNNELKNQWSKLDQNQQADFARMIIANNLLDTSVFKKFGSAELDSLQGRSYKTYDVDESYNKFNKDWLSGIVKLRKQIATTTAILLVSLDLVKKIPPNPLALGFALAANAVSFGWLIKSTAEQYEIVDKYLNKTLKAFGFESADGQLTTAVVLNNNQSKLIAPRINFDNITESERNDKGLSWFFSSYSETYLKFEKVNKILTELKRYVVGDASDVLWSEKLKSTKVKNTLAVPAKNIEVMGVSNDKIKITTTTDAEGRLKIKAESSITEETNFTFTLKYKGSSAVGNTGISKVIDAVFKPASGYDYEGLWDYGDLSALSNNRTEDHVCDLENYQIKFNYNHLILNIEIKDETVIWTEKINCVEKSTNRPLTCGGPYERNFVDDDSWTAKIISRKDNEILISYAQGENYSLIFSNITSDYMTISMRDEWDKSVLFTHKFNKKK